MKIFAFFDIELMEELLDVILQNIFLINLVFLRASFATWDQYYKPFFSCLKVLLLL